MYRGTVYNAEGNEEKVVEAKTILQLFKVFRNIYGTCVGMREGRPGDEIERVWVFSYCVKGHAFKRGNCLKAVNVYVLVEEL